MPICFIQGYEVADTIYTNWDSIKELVDNLQEGKLLDAAISATNITGNIAVDKLSSFPIENLWGEISGSISKDRQEIARVAFYGLMDGLTEPEVDFAKQFLKKMEISARHVSEQTGVGYSQNSNSNNNSHRFPKEMRYV